MPARSTRPSTADCCPVLALRTVSRTLCAPTSVCVHVHISCGPLGGVRGGGGGGGGGRERRNIYNIYGTATLNPKRATQRRNITEGRWQRVNRVLQARLRGSACMREVAQAQKALRAVLQRFAKRSAHVATFRCVGAALGASGLLSVVLRAAGSLASSLVGTGCR